MLSPTPPGTAWTPSERIEECRGYLGYAHSDCAFFAGDLSGLREAERLGLRLAAGFSNIVFKFKGNGTMSAARGVAGAADRDFGLAATLGVTY